MRVLRTVMCLLGGLLLIAPVHAATLTRLGPVLGDGNAHEVAVQGNVAAVAAMNYLLLVDISTPAAPVRLSRTPVYGICTSVALAGNYAYLATHYDLRVYDVTNPSQPQLVRTLPQYPADAVKEDGGWLYVAAGFGGLVILDLAQPDDPQLLGAYTETDIKVEDFAFSGSMFYLAASRLHSDFFRPEFIVVDFQNVATPSVRGRWTPPSGGGAGSVAVRGTTAYFDVGTSIQLLNVSSPTTPTPTSTVSVGSSIGDLDIYLNRLVVVTSTGARFYNLSTTAPPSLLGSIPLSGTANRGTLVGTTLYRASGNSGVDIIDYTVAAQPAPLGNYNEPSFVRRVTREGNIVYGCGERLWVFDITVPGAPVITDRLNYDALGSVVVGNRLYVAAGAAGLAVLDITDPAHPATIAVVPTAGSAGGIALLNGRLVILRQSQGLAVYGLTNPDLPALDGSVAISGAGHMSGGGTTAYVTHSGTVDIVDLSTPSTPSVVGALTGFDSIVNLRVANDRLYLLDYFFGVRIYDIASPTAPSSIGEIERRTYNGGFDVDGDRVYLDSTNPVTMYAYDASNPAAAAELASYAQEATADFLMDVDAQDELIVAGLYTGFAVYRLDGAISAVPEPGPRPGLALTVGPNPFRDTVRLQMSGLAGRDAGPAQLTLFDAAGRLVRRWAVESAGADAALTWDGHDSAGRAVAAGSYFLRLSSGAGSVSARVQKTR